MTAVAAVARRKRREWRKFPSQAEKRRDGGSGALVPIRPIADDSALMRELRQPFPMFAITVFPSSACFKTKRV